MTLKTYISRWFSPEWYPAYFFVRLTCLYSGSFTSLGPRENHGDCCNSFFAGIMLLCNLNDMVKALHLKKFYLNLIHFEMNFIVQQCKKLLICCWHWC